MTVINVTDTATRAELVTAIEALRAKAVRLSRRDPKRDDIDAEVDILVDQWLVS